MASKVNKKFSFDVTGIINLSSLDEEHDVFIEVEDFDAPIRLSEYAKEFDGKDVKLTLGYKNEL